MKAAALVAALAVLWVTAAAAADGERRYATEAEADRWAGVGLVAVRGAGRCSGVLIRPDVVLTAAHCIADADRRTVAKAADVSFAAGVKKGRGLASARARRVEAHPAYFSASDRYDERRVRVDLAKVYLDRPIDAAPSYKVDYTPPVGAPLALLSYSRGRMSDLSIQTPCPIAARRTEFLLMDCRSDPGASGAPYFRIGRGGALSVVGVNSGTRGRGADRKALALAFDHVRDFIGPTVGRPAKAAAPPPSAGAASASERRTRLPGASRPGDRIGVWK